MAGKPHEQLAGPLSSYLMTMGSTYPSPGLSRPFARFGRGPSAPRWGPTRSASSWATPRMGRARRRGLAGARRRRAQRGRRGALVDARGEPGIDAPLRERGDARLRHTARRGRVGSMTGAGGAYRTVSAEEAAAAVRDGDVLYCSLASLDYVLDAITARRDLRDVRVRLTTPGQDPGWLTPEAGDERFTVDFQIFIGDFARHATDSGLASYIPNLFSTELKQVERPDGCTFPDVFITRVSRPNEKGYVNFGPMLFNKRAYVRQCHTVIAEIDDTFPVFHGDCHRARLRDRLPRRGRPRTGQRRNPRERGAPRGRDSPRQPPRSDRLDPRPLAAGPAAAQLLALPQARPGRWWRRSWGGARAPTPTRSHRRSRPTWRKSSPTARTSRSAWASRAARLCGRGAFDGKQGLGLHSEMIIPGWTRLIHEGVMTDAHKQFRPGVAVAAGVGRLHSPRSRLHRGEPALRATPLRPRTRPEGDVGQRPRARDQQRHQRRPAGPDQRRDRPRRAHDQRYRRSAGQPLRGDVLNGRARHHGHEVDGPSAAPPRASWRRTSRATVVTIPRSLADTIITEHGVARLFGKSVRERAAELIAIRASGFPRGASARGGAALRVAPVSAATRIVVDYTSAIEPGALGGVAVIAPDGAKRRFGDPAAPIRLHRRLP